MDAPPPVLTLAVEKGPREGETQQCRAGAALRVGRVVPGNDLAVRDVGASQRHLAIEFLPPPAARWAVSDLGSSNGTLLNGALLVPSVPATLCHGDLISVGESTVLAVSIAPDLDPNPNPGPRRSSRRAAAVAAVEEKPTVATRRSTLKKAAAEPSEAEREVHDAAAVVLEEESSRVVTRRGRRKKASEAGKEETEEFAEAPRCGGRKKAVEPPELEKADEPKEEGGTMVTRRGGRKKAAKLSEPEMQQEAKEEAVVVTRHGGRKKDAATAAPPPLPPNTRSGRGRGRVTRASARKEQDENEVTVPREQTGNLLSATAVKSDEGEKGDTVAAGDGEVEGNANALEEEAPVARRGRARRAPKGRTNAQCGTFDKGGEGENGGGVEEEDGKREVVGSGGEAGYGKNAEDHAGRSSLKTMTLREWFERMEKYLPMMINEAADEMILILEERHWRVDEYMSALGNNSHPS